MRPLVRAHGATDTTHLHQDSQHFGDEHIGRSLGSQHEATAKVSIEDRVAAQHSQTAEHTLQAQLSLQHGFFRLLLAIDLAAPICHGLALRHRIFVYFASIDGRVAWNGFCGFRCAVFDVPVESQGYLQTCNGVREQLVRVSDKTVSVATGVRDSCVLFTAKSSVRLNVRGIQVAYQNVSVNSPFAVRRVFG